MTQCSVVEITIQLKKVKELIPIGFSKIIFAYQPPMNQGRAIRE
jgi:hypothetical protein